MEQRAKAWNAMKVLQLMMYGVFVDPDKDVEVLLTEPKDDCDRHMAMCKAAHMQNTMQH